MELEAKKSDPQASQLQQAVSQSSSARLVSRGCSYDTAFKYLADTVKLPNMKLLHTQGGRLTITPSGLGSSEGVIVIDCSDVPCFVITIPEMLTSYIIAQLLRIAEAQNSKIEGEPLATVNKVRVNIQSKILVLQQIGDHYTGKQSS